MNLEKLIDKLKPFKNKSNKLNISWNEKLVRKRRIENLRSIKRIIKSDNKLLKYLCKGNLLEKGYIGCQQSLKKNDEVKFYTFRINITVE